MELNSKKFENTIVVYLSGRLDVHFTRELEKAVNTLVSAETSSHLVFNFSEVEYVSSSSLGLFISLTRVYKERRLKFILCNINGSFKKILEVVELTSLFHILKTENDALDYIRNADVEHYL